MDDIYYEAADILRRLDNKETSFRKLIFDSSSENKKLLYKICFETLKRRKGFDRILEELPDLANCQNYEDNSNYLLHVLLYEYLFGFGLKKCCKEWRQPIENFSSDLAKLKNDVFYEKNLTENDKNEFNFDKNCETSEQNGFKKDAQGVYQLPRYARVNTLKITVQEATDKLVNDGWIFVNVEEKIKRKNYRNLIDNLQQYNFCVDIHLEDLLVFPSGTDLHNEELVTSGCLTLQDKSSCLPTLCLQCEPGSHVMDMCAAPGVKTSHIAAILHNEGQIFAYDKNFERYNLMHSLLERNGVTCAIFECQDMLRLNLKDKKYWNVKYVILDPPCSGSGMVKRLDFLTDGQETKDISRLQRLANLQATMLKHALTLPNLHRLVYSTCSIHEEENEQVVGEALGHVQDRFHLVKAMPQWKHRGRRNYDFGKLCLRASPEKDRTNGFFVAVFEAIS